MISIIHSSFPGHTQHVTSFLVIDNRFLVTASWDRNVISWSLDSKQIIDLQLKHSAPIIAICYFDKKRTLFSLSKDEEIKKWNISKSGKIILIKSKKFKNIAGINSKKIHFDNKRLELLVFKSNRRLDVLTEDLKIKTIYNLKTQGIFRKFIVIDNDNLLLIFSTAIGLLHLKNKHFTLISKAEQISTVSTYFNNKRDLMILFGTYSGVLSLINLRKRKKDILKKLEDAIVLIYKENSDFIIQTSSNIKYLAEINKKSLIFKRIDHVSKRSIRTTYKAENWQLKILFNNDMILLNDSEQFKHLFKGYPKAWSFIAIGDKLIIGLADGSILDNETLFTITKGPITALHASNIDSNSIILSTGSGKIVFYDYMNKKIIDSMKLHFSKIWNIKLYNERILTASNDKTTLFFYHNDNSNEKIYLKHQYSVNDSCFVSQANKIITITDNGLLYLWSLSGIMEKEILVSKNHLKTLALSEKNSLAIIGSYDKKLYFFDLRQMKILEKNTIFLSSLILKIAINPTGTFIAVGTEDGRLRIINIETQDIHSMKELYSPIYDIRWTKKDECLVLCSNGMVSKHEIDYLALVH